MHCRYTYINVKFIFNVLLQNSLLITLNMMEIDEEIQPISELIKPEGFPWFARFSLIDMTFSLHIRLCCP